MNARLEGIVNEVIADFQAGRLNCAESVLSVMNRYFAWESPCVPRIATPFGGGIGGSQHACGAFTGGAMAIGLRYGREAGGDKVPANEKVQELIRFFETRHGALDCKTLLGMSTSDPFFRVPGGKHDTVCVPLVSQVCAFLAAQMEQDT